MASKNYFKKGNKVIPNDPAYDVLSLGYLKKGNKVIPNDSSYDKLSLGYFEKGEKLIPNITSLIFSDVPIASFYASAAKALKELIIGIEPVQEGSGDPAPDNIRPISGWSEANIITTGKNILGGDLLLDGLKTNMPNAAGDDPINRTFAFAANATTVPKGITAASGLTDRFKENTQYTFIITASKSSGTSSNLRIYYTDGSTENINLGTTQKITVAIVSAENKTVRGLFKYNASGTTTLYYDESGIFEGVYTVDDFVPYAGQTYPVSFGRTIYGGTLNVTTGLLTETKGYIAAYAGEELPGEWISDRDVYAPETTPTTGAEVVYDLAVPVEYQLTGVQVNTLAGQNNIWADTGDIISLIYEA